MGRPIEFKTECGRTMMGVGIIEYFLAIRWARKQQRDSLRWARHTSMIIREQCARVDEYQYAYREE